jgi:hypothetical protein
MELEGFGTTEFNFNHTYRAQDKHNEPFILASQAKQVYHVQDPVNGEWNAVTTPTIRDLFDMDCVDIEQCECFFLDCLHQ